MIFGPDDENRTRLGLADNESPYPDDYVGIIWVARLVVNLRLTSLVVSEVSIASFSSHEPRDLFGAGWGI